MSGRSLCFRTLLMDVIRVALVNVGAYITFRMVMKQLDPLIDKRQQEKIEASKLLSLLGISPTTELSQHELAVLSQLVNTEEAGASWREIGGYEDVLEELKETVILPFQMNSRSRFLQPPKGVLLYGPPGCGKTLIARAIARCSESRFLNLDMSLMTDKWYGESQKFVSALFSVARKIQPTIIFIDEIDSFLRMRNLGDHEVTAQMKALFLSGWDGFATDPDCRVLIIGATNRPQDVDNAILRRLPSRFCVPLPDEDGRHQVLRVMLNEENLAPDVSLEAIAEMCNRFTCSDLRELCRLSAVIHLRRKDRNELRNQPSVLFDMDDCRAAFERMKESMQFSTASYF